MLKPLKRSRRATTFAAAVFNCLLMAAISPTAAWAVNFQYLDPTPANPSGLLIPRSTQSYGGTNSTRNGLPPTVMDSFVNEAQEHKELIYGDESHEGPPPYMLFTKAHRINTGIVDQRDAGLTTGHGSYMPDGVGGDEFLSNEWSQSGAQGVSALNGFYNGITYGLPSAYAPDPTQFPGLEMNVLQTMDGQIDEVRWGMPPPLQWNQSNPAPITIVNRDGSSRTVPGTWFRSGDGWRNALGDRLAADGTLTYGSARPMVGIEAGTTIFPDGSRVTRSGQTSRPAP